MYTLKSITGVRVSAALIAEGWSPKIPPTTNEALRHDKSTNIKTFFNAKQTHGNQSNMIMCKEIGSMKESEKLGQRALSH